MCMYRADINDLTSTPIAMCAGILYMYVYIYINVYPCVFMRTCIFKCMCSCVGKPVLAQTCSFVLLEETHMTSIFSHLLQIVFISAATVQGPKIAASHPARLLDRPPCGKIKARLVGACRSPWLRIRTRKPGPDAATLAGLPRIILPKKGTSRPRSLRNRGLSQLPNSRPHRVARIQPTQQYKTQ